jgi:hypothetical protein
MQADASDCTLSQITHWDLEWLWLATNYVQTMLTNLLV